MKTLLDIWRPERSNPWQEFNSLQRRMDLFFENFGSEVDFAPACDFEETDDAYLISIDVPGMTKDQLQVELSGNTLTVSGERKEEKKEEKAGRRSTERFHGRFERAFTLPQISEGEKVEADYKDGVLSIKLPKSAEAKAKTRKIQIGESKSASTPKIARSEEKKEHRPNEKAA